MINERIVTTEKQNPITRHMSDADYNELRIQIGQRICEALETTNYTHISEMLGIPSISNTKLYITGSRFPSAEVLARFKARGYSLDWLFTGEGSKYAKNENLFEDDDAARIQSLARKNYLSFWEQVVKLSRAGLSFLDEMEKWKK